MQGMQISESTILRMLADTNTQRQAFTIIVQQYSRPLYCMVRRMVLVHDDADDVLQNTFLKAWKSLPDFEGKSKISTWLYRIAVNEALDFIRKKNACSVVSGDENELLGVYSRLLADEYFDGNQAEAKLHAAVSMLPDVQRTVFQMKYFEEMKYSEISKILGTSQGALKASYHLAVKKISEFLKNERIE